MLQKCGLRESENEAVPESLIMFVLYHHNDFTIERFKKMPYLNQLWLGESSATLN